VVLDTGPTHRHESGQDIPDDDVVALRVVAETGSVVDAAGLLLSEQHGISTQAALDLLTQVAEGQGRQVEDVAEDVVLIGLPDLQTPITLRTRPGVVVTPRSPDDPDGPDRLTRPPDAPDPRPATRGSTPASAALLELLATLTSPQELLSAMADLAVHIVPGCASAGITVIRDGRPPGTAATDARAEAISKAQYLEGDGPCLHAVGTGRPALIDDVSLVPSGPGWLQAARDAGITAVIALPLPGTADDVAAVLTVYADRPGGWPRETTDTAVALAACIGGALTVADRLAEPVDAPHGADR
jgi:hypothetical protein